MTTTSLPLPLIPSLLIVALFTHLLFRGPCLEDGDGKAGEGDEGADAVASGGTANLHRWGLTTGTASRARSGTLGGGGCGLGGCGLVVSGGTSGAGLRLGLGGRGGVGGAAGDEVIRELNAVLDGAGGGVKALESE